MTSFLQSPWWWSLAALLPVLVIFYLLKLKRKRVVVPSTLLWRRSVQDLVANAPFQKLRNNLLLWLQLLLLALLIFGFMRPVMKLQDQSGTTLILLIDNSASMQTHEGALTRLEMAKKSAREAVDNLSSKDEAIVVSFSNRTNIIQTLTSDRALLRAAIESIESRDVETSLHEAGLILQGLTSTVDATGARTPRDNTKTVILSDGMIDGLDSMVDIPNLEYVKIGGASENMGISAVDVRESFADTYEYQVFTSVTNASDEEKEAYIEFHVDDEIVDIKSTMVPAHGTSGVVFATGELLDGLATIRLDGNDEFDLDNEAKVQISPPAEIDILLVTAGNPFLEKVFMIDPRTRISVIRPTDYSPRDDFDIVVFDSCTAGEIPAGSFVFLNSLPPISGFEKTSETDIDNPQIIDWNRVHPLTRFANFEEVLIGKAMPVSVPRSAIPIVEALETNLITLYESDTQRVLVIGFDIFKSYWPLDVSFPIFMTNLIDYFSRQAVGVYQPVYATGSTIPIYPGRDATKATVTTPSGEKIDFSFEGISTAYLTETHKAGVYHVDFDNGSTVQLPVNLLSENESLVAPVEELKIGGRENVVGVENVVKTNREVWHWFVLGALAILMIEWLIYCKRTFM